MDIKSDIVSLVKNYTKDLYTYAISKIAQKEIAEDLVQDTFLSAHQSYQNFKGNSNVKTWLFSILKNKIADHYRLKYKENTQSSSGILQEFFNKNEAWKSEYKPLSWGNEKELLDDPDFAKALKGCFEKLPQQGSIAVRLKYLEEQKAETICSKLEISKTNYWQIIHRAKLQLRNCLELKWFRK